MYRNPVLLAREWQKSLNERTHASRADLARSKGISRARVTQLLNLLRLSPRAQSMVSELGDPLAFGTVAERWLRPLIACSEDEQMVLLRKVLEKNLEPSP